MTAGLPSRERPSPRTVIPSFSITRSEAAFPGLVYATTWSTPRTSNA
jgi:hypothetical protein